MRIRVLMVEDFEPDALQIVLELQRGGFEVEFERVETELALREALTHRTWDAIISDYSLPGFSGPQALRILQSFDLDLPFIIVSGVVPEEGAVQAVRAGAHDFISKGRFARLCPALERELRDAAARRERARARSDLDAVLECAPSVIIATDREGRIQFINQVLDQYSKRDVIGTDWLTFLPRERHAELAARHARVVETGTAETYEVCITQPDDTRVWFSSHMGPMRDGHGIRGVVIVATDVTELRRTQEEFAATQRMAAMGTLAAGIAHEINTPTQFVSDSVHFLRDASLEVFEFTDALLELRNKVEQSPHRAEFSALLRDIQQLEESCELPYLKEQLPQAFGRCIEGLQRVTTIVRSMKEFAYPGQQSMAAADLNRAINSTLVIAQNEYRYVADLVTDLGELPPVICHLHDINQVVLNLVVNAAHAIADAGQGGETRGQIRVSTRRLENVVEIRVSDTGTGIAPEIRQRVFEPFFTTKMVGRGTGQGLSLAWTVVRERHGGDLSFETVMGQGTTFVVRLPVGGPSLPPTTGLRLPAPNVLAVDLALRGDTPAH